MNELKSLVSMELRKLFSLRVIFPIYVAVMLIFGAFGKGKMSMMPSFGFMIFIYLWVYGPVGYGGDLLYGILPVTRGQIVRARYLYSLLGIAGGTLAIKLLQMLPLGEGAPFPASLLFCGGCVFAATVTPPLLYFGPVKSRYFVMAVYIIGFAASGAFAGITKEPDAWSSLQPGVAAAVISLALLAVSYFISQRLFSRRQFDL